MQPFIFICEKCGAEHRVNFSGSMFALDKLRKASGYQNISKRLLRGKSWKGVELKARVCSECRVEYRALLLRHDREIAEFFNFDLKPRIAERIEFLKGKGWGGYCCREKKRGGIETD